MSTSPNAVSASSVQHDVGQQRERAVVELHAHALERAERRRDLEQLQDDRRVRPEHRARGDAEEEAVADLAGSPGDGDAYRCGHRRRAYADAPVAPSRSRPPRQVGPRHLVDQAGVVVLALLVEVDAVVVEAVARALGGPSTSQSSTVTFGCVAGRARTFALLPATHSRSALLVSTTTTGTSARIAINCASVSSLNGPFVPRCTTTT